MPVAPWGQEARLYVHEMGHSLGLPHSGWRYYDYDSHHDEMSRGHPAKSVKCGTYRSANAGNAMTDLFCSEPGAGYIMVHQDYLGWIPAANKKTHDAAVGIPKDYVIEANSVALGSRIKLVIVCITGKPCSGAEDSTATFVTVEVKLHAGKFDNGVPSEGVVIHGVRMNRGALGEGDDCYFNTQSGWAVPFDATLHDFDPALCVDGDSPEMDEPGHGLMNMTYGVGKTFSSARLGVTVQVLSRTGNTFKVRVTKTK